MQSAHREERQHLFWPDPEAFWQFSGEAYGEQDVAAACLEAQDNFGADVNVILLCLWMDTRGVRMQGDDWANLLRTSRIWQRDTLEPQRKKRQALKGHSDYEAAKRDELALEQQAQAALLESLEEPPIRHEAADSLMHYFESLGADISLFRPTA